MSKVISFSDDDFELHKKTRLSGLMVETLLAACQKQHKGIPFGPADTKGSFISLIGRGLIIRKQITKNDRSELMWQVTPEAVALLKSMGIDTSC